MPEPNKLKSIDEHNTQRRREKKEREDAARRTGVACPNCSEELLWVCHDGFAAMMGVYPSPSTSPATCRSCKVTVDLER